MSRAIIMTLLAVGLLAAAPSALADPIVLDFEDLEAPDGGLIKDIQSYEQYGFVITSSDEGGFVTYGVGHPTGWADSEALANNRQNATTFLDGTGSEPFSILSIDLSEKRETVIGPTPINFTGVLADGSTVTTQFRLDQVFGYETFSFEGLGFTNLVSLSWIQEAKYHQFDNIVLAAAANVIVNPEPGSLLLVAAGGGTVMLFRRRRRRRAAA